MTHLFALVMMVNLNGTWHTYVLDQHQTLDDCTRTLMAMPVHQQPDVVFGCEREPQL